MNRREIGTGDPSKRSQEKHRDFLPGISSASVNEYCDALEFSVHGHEATAAEKRRLRNVLLRMSREAHAAAMPPERLLIGLRHVWTSVCGRNPSADLFDPLWDAVVTIALDAYESARPE